MGKVADRLSKAIAIIDAQFTRKQGEIHSSKHAKEMGMSKNEYLYNAEVSSLSSGKEWIIYKRKDGMTVKFNIRNNDYVVYNPKTNNILTYHGRRKSQVISEMQREGIKIPKELLK